MLNREMLFISEISRIGGQIVSTKIKGLRTGLTFIGECFNEASGSVTKALLFELFPISFIKLQKRSGE